MADPQEAFDFSAHGQTAITAYLKVRDFYRDLAFSVKRISEECLRRRNIKVHSVDARAKEASSFGKKAAQPSETDPNKPMYPDPLRQITDLAGIRIIAYLPGTLHEIDGMICSEFQVLERSDKSEVLLAEDRFGYQSVHYLVKLSGARACLAEYERFNDAIAEIQVRTILQHAWAEIEHDIQYKSSDVIPTEIHRRFMSLAGLMEIADREFQAIQDKDTELRAAARSRVKEGELQGVEITPDALKAYLDKRLAPDARIADWVYDWTAKLLRRLGFKTLGQVDECVHDYDDDRLARLAYGSRQGQITRFECMLLAAMQENYISRHPYFDTSWFAERSRTMLSKFKEGGIKLHSYDPLTQK